MRKALFAGLVFVVCGSAATAQFTLTPKVGIENFNTCLKGLDGTSSLSPQASVRMDYQFNKLHGPFVGLATNRAQTGFSYADGKASTTDTKTSLRFETGYMMNIKAMRTLRVQPFAGMAFGNNTSFISGANVVVARKFVVGVQYLQVLNSNDVEMVVPDKEGVALVGTNVSAFSVNVGVPITFKKKAKPEVKKQPEVKKSCSYYKTRCGKWQ